MAARRRLSLRGRPPWRCVGVFVGLGTFMCFLQDVGCLYTKTRFVAVLPPPKAGGPVEALARVSSCLSALKLPPPKAGGPVEGSRDAARYQSPAARCGPSIRNMSPPVRQHPELWVWGVLGIRYTHLQNTHRQDGHHLPHTLLGCGRRFWVAVLESGSMVYAKPRSMPRSVPTGRARDHQVWVCAGRVSCAGTCMQSGGGSPR